MTKNLLSLLAIVLIINTIKAQPVDVVQHLSHGNLKTSVWYLDTDGDGYGTDTDSVLSDQMPTGYAAVKGDCNDSNAGINPGATEICGNGTDENCDGIALQDTIAPVAHCIPSIKLFLNEFGLAILSANSLNEGSTDNCSGLSFSADQDTFLCPELWVHMVTLTASDLAGNTGTCQSIVKISDQIAPTAVCKSSFALPLDNWGNATLSPADLDEGSFDNCGITNQWIDNTAFSCADIGEHTVELHLEDAYGNTNSCAAIIIISDKIRPTVICKEISTIALDSAGSVQLSALAFDQGSYDVCRPTLLYSIDQSSFDCNDLGVHTVTLTVEDLSGNTNACETELSVVDKIKPVAVCTDSMILELDLTGFAFLTAEMINHGSFDNCEITDLRITPPQLTQANLGYNSVILTVLDASGNESTCETNIELLEKTSGTNHPDPSVDIVVFPNPSTGHFNLQMPDGRMCERAEIFNAAGQLVWAQKASTAAPLDLDISGQISGCYYLRVQTGRTLRTSKLILMR